MGSNVWEKFVLGPLEAWGQLPQYRDEPLLVIQHGAGGQASNYECIVRALPFPAIAVNQPGHGTNGGGFPATVDEMAENIEQATRLLNRPFVLVGHSLGGAIAIEVALRKKAGVEALVLYSTGAKLKVSQVIFDNLEKNYHVHNRQSVRIGFGDQATDDMLDRYLAMPRHPTNRQSLSDFRAADRFDRMSDIGGIRLPVLVVGGDSDKLTPPKYQDFLAAGIPGARRVIIPGVGHQAHFEAPELFLAAVTSFVQNVSGKERSS